MTPPNANPFNPWPKGQPATKNQKPENRIALESDTMSEQVWQIARWLETSETSESRKYKSLTWISSRVDFNSTGWNEGVCEFGMEWFSIYCCFDILRRVAATSKVRGVLCGEKGEPFTARRVLMQAHCFIPGMDGAEELMNRCMDWAKRVGWLVPYETPPGDSPGNLPESREITTATGQDRTGQNPTGQDRTGQPKHPSRPGPNSFESLKRSPNLKRSPQLSAEVATLIANNPDLKPLQLIRVAPDATDVGAMETSVFQPLTASDVKTKPPMWWAAIWYKRQLAAPDPVLRGCNAAEAAIVVALALSLATVKDAQVKNSRTSMFISLMTKGCSGLQSRAAPHLPKAIELVTATLNKSRELAST